jgi:acetyl esterase/lipase
MTMPSRDQPRMGRMPSQIEQGLRALGRVIDPPATAALYAPLHESEPYSGVKVTRDLRYGPADRHRLDVFTAQGARGPLPVLMFVHGGGFVAGDKNTEGSPFYDNVPLWAARHGLVGVNMTYRLAPQFMWPAGSEDVGAAVRWIADNASAHGGDPTRIFVFGHSAGAAHVAAYLAEHEDGQRPALAGAILMSGIYDLTSLGPEGSYRSYYGDDPARYAERSPLPGLVRTSLPLLIVTAELDPQRFIDQSEALCAALSARPAGGHQYVHLPKHSHISEGYAIGTDDTVLTDEILELVGP